MTPAASLAIFDRIYVINLPHRDDRRREMAAQLRGIGMALDRAPMRLFPAIRPDARTVPDDRHARGCFASHLGVLRDAEQGGCRRILVLEDDVDFAPGFEAAFARVAECLAREPWDLFYGGYRIDPAEHRVVEGAVVEAVPPEVTIVTAHFIAFSAATIGAVASYLQQLLERPPGDPAGGPMHVDGAYSWYRRNHPACRTLIADRQLAVQRPSRTDIHALAWYDRVPLVRDAAQALRRWRRTA